MKSFIGLIVAATFAAAQPLKVEVDVTTKGGNCLQCLLADGHYCEGATKTEGSCVKQGTACGDKQKLVVGFNQCGRSYFEMNDLKVYRTWPLLEPAKVDKKELDKPADKIVVRNCKNIELPFNPNTPQNELTASSIKAYPGNKEMKEPNDIDGTKNTVLATEEQVKENEKTGANHPILGNYVIDLAPESGCYFTATNNMQDFKNGDGEIEKYMMGVGFMLNNNYDVKILVDNNMPIYPEVWSEGATTKNWLLYTNINPSNIVEKGIVQKLSAGNGRVPVLNFKPRHFLLINQTKKKQSIQVVFGVAAALQATILSVAGLIACSM